MDDKYSDSLPDHSTTTCSSSLQKDIAKEMQNVDAFFDEMISNNNDDYDDHDDYDGCNETRRSGGRCLGGSDVTGANRAVVAGSGVPSAESIELMRENVELLNAFAVNNETMFGLCTSLQTVVKRSKRSKRSAAAKRTSRTAKATTAVSCPRDDDADVRLDGVARGGRGAISAAAEPSEGPPPRQDKDCCRSADDHRGAGRPQRSSCRDGVRTDDDRFYGRDRSAAVSGEFVNAGRGEQQKNVPMSSCTGAAVTSKAPAGQRLFRRDGFAISPSSADASADASVDGSLSTSAQDFIVYDDDDDDYGDDEDNSACEYDDSQDYADHWTNTADRYARSD